MNKINPLQTKMYCFNPKHTTDGIKGGMNKDEAMPKNMALLIDELSNSKGHNEALEALFERVDTGEVEQIDGVLFKSGEYMIQNVFKPTGILLERNMKEVNRLKLDIAPMHVKTIVKDDDMFIISKVKGTKSGQLIPFYAAREAVPKENKLSAFHDMQSLTRAGLMDTKVLNSASSWYVTPDDKRIVIPVFEALKPIDPSDNRKDILDRYHQIIFR